MEPEREHSKSFFAGIFELLLVALVIVLPIRLFIAQPFIVNGASMEPTFSNGQYLIVDEISYRFKEPKRGDVVVFKYPPEPSKYLIKRVIGLPGETVLLQNGKVEIRSDEHPEGMELSEPYISEFWTGDAQTVILEEHEYFVMGDNRPASSDSRFWGPLPEENIVGRAFLRLLPISHTEIFPGAHIIETEQ